MRLLYLAGVAILAFVAGGDAKDSRVFDISNQHRVHVASTSVVSTTRLLRTRSIIDEERAGGGISVSGADKLAKLLKSSKVTDEQLQKWLSKGKPAEKVFYRMDLTNPRITKPFESPQFIRWLQYADDLSAGKGTSAISVLSTQYGDDSLYKMIELAKKESKTKALGTRLQADQLEHWVTTRKDPDEVFKLYDLNNTGKNLLNEPQFSAWAKYVDDLNVNGKKEGTAVVSIIPTLKKHYSDEDLFKIVLVAKEIDKTETMGTKLEDAFETPENVLVELGLRETTKTLLENPLLNVLTKYTEVYSAKYKKTTVIETLTRTFGDKMVAKMLLSGKAEATTKRIATKFETEQLEMWRDSGKSVDDVYKLLNLPRFRDLLTDFGGKPLFNTWLEYINTLSIKNPEKTSATFSTLATSFNDRPMMQILQAAKKYPQYGKFRSQIAVGEGSTHFSHWSDENPNTVKLAKLAEKERMKEWLEKWIYSPNYAFRDLKLNKLGEKVFSSPKFELWVKYLDDWNKTYSHKKMTMIDGIRGNYHDLDLVPLLAAAEKVPSTQKLASQLQDALVDKWIAEKKTVAYLKGWLIPGASSDDILKRFTTKRNSA